MVTRGLQGDGVVVDAVVIGLASDQIGTQLRAITVATGGCAFHPATIHEALRLFETETILSLRRRAVTDAYRPMAVVATAEQLSQYAAGRLGAPQGWEAAPAAHIPQGVREAVSLPSTALNQALVDPRGRSSADARTKRILRELSACVRKPHPSFDVFPCETQLDFWQLLLRGPESTPYVGGVFHLWLQFPADYPAEAPEVRFITPIHHCNINSHGKVCHSVFDRNWTTDTKVGDVLSCVYGLLLAPEPDDPLDSVLALQCLTHRAVYEAAAAELTRSKASESYDSHKVRLLADDAATSRSLHPQHLCCPLTMELFVTPVTTKHGHTFEKDALIEALRRSAHCPLSRLPLTVQEAEALNPSIFIKSAVDQYKNATPWWDELVD